jgi:hypothetical protein
MSRPEHVGIVLAALPDQWRAEAALLDECGEHDHAARLTRAADELSRAVPAHATLHVQMQAGEPTVDVEAWVRAYVAQLIASETTAQPSSLPRAS